jgi:hypothetical protein
LKIYTKAEADSRYLHVAIKKPKRAKSIRHSVALFKTLTSLSFPDIAECLDTRQYYEYVLKTILDRTAASFEVGFLNISLCLVVIRFIPHI